MNTRTLKGQNLRICNWDSTSSKWKVIGMATSCQITLTNNTDDAATKDDVAMASKPTVTTKSWNVSVESLNVSDAAALLSDIKNFKEFTLMWDETSTTDNQTREKEEFARKGKAYLVDAVFAFNDRENVQKSLQFSGNGPISLVPTSEESEVIPMGSYTKGQFVRLFLGGNNSAVPSSVIAAAKQLSLHTAVTLEDATTKDTQGDWQIQEPTGLSYDITTSALVRSGETITSGVGAQQLQNIEEIYENGTPVRWQIANVVGANQRTKATVIVSGSAVLTQLSISAAVRSNATYEAQLNGYGEYVIGSTEMSIEGLSTTQDGTVTPVVGSEPPYTVSTWSLSEDIYVRGANIDGSWIAETGGDLVAGIVNSTGTAVDLNTDRPDWTFPVAIKRNGTTIITVGS